MYGLQSVCTALFGSTCISHVMFPLYTYTVVLLYVTHWCFTFVPMGVSIRAALNLH
jgi:hypothetical protein